MARGRVHQSDTARQARFTSPAYLLQRDLRLGPELDLLRDARLLPACAILRPRFRQIQPISHRDTGGMVGDRQRYGHLAVGLLSELTAILVVNADRMLALLRK